MGYSRSYRNIYLEPPNMSLLPKDRFYLYMFLDQVYNPEIGFQAGAGAIILFVQSICMVHCMMQAVAGRNEDCWTSINYGQSCKCPRQW